MAAVAVAMAILAMDMIASADSTDHRRRSICREAAAVIIHMDWIMDTVVIVAAAAAALGPADKIYGLRNGM